MSLDAYPVRPCYDVLPGVPLPWESDNDVDEDIVAEELEESPDDEDMDSDNTELDEDDTVEAVMEMGTDEDLDDISAEEFDLDGDEPVFIPGVYENGMPTAWAIANLDFYKDTYRKCTICDKKYDTETADPTDHPSLCHSCSEEMADSIEDEDQCIGCGTSLDVIDETYCSNCIGEF